jgi:hypothetical protein
MSAVCLSQGLGTFLLLLAEAFHQVFGLYM